MQHLALIVTILIPARTKKTDRCNIRRALVVVPVSLALLIWLLPMISGQVGNAPPAVPPPARPVSANPPPTDPAVFLEGLRLNQDQVSALEKTLDETPNDLNTRLKLLGHYSMTKNGDGKNGDENFAKHLLWLVDHNPESAILGIGIIELNWNPPLAFITEYTKHWEQAAAAHSTDSAVLSHAARVVSGSDRDLGLSYARKSVELDASCTRCRNLLGVLIGVAILRLPGSMEERWTCLPNTPDVEQTVSDLRKEVASSSDPEVVLDAGMTIKGYSGLYGSRCGGNSDEAARFGGELIRKSVSLDPSLVNRRGLQDLLKSIQ